MTRNRGYIEWDSTQDGEPAKSPFDDPVVRERIIQIIVQAAAGPKKFVRLRP
jgi:hypothetical protein